MSKSSLWLTVGEGRDIGNHDCDDVTRAGLGIPDGIYRISTPLPMDLAPGGFTFNQYLVVDKEPLLLHTGPRGLFASVRRARAAARAPELDRLLARRGRRVRQPQSVVGGGASGRAALW